MSSLFKILQDRNDFMYTFKAIDKSQSFSIGPSELEIASQTYGKERIEYVFKCNRFEFKER